MTYRLFALALDSDTPLPELSARTRQRGDLRVQLRSTAIPRRRWTWMEGWRRGRERPWLLVGRHGDDWLLRFPRLADFLVTGGATLIVGHNRGIPLHTVRHLLIDHVVPLVLSARGHSLLHASAVASADGAVIFAGASGAGKSTVAASFTSGRHRFFSDDAVQVVRQASGFGVARAHGGARLWPDALSAVGRRAAASRPIAHYSTKRRMPDVRAARSHDICPLRAVYLLDPPAVTRPMSIRAIGRRDALVELLRHCYTLDPLNASTARQQFDMLADVCAAVPVFALSFPRDLRRLDELRSMIAAHMSIHAAA